jgi:hypothetical protein
MPINVVEVNKGGRIIGMKTDTRERFLMLAAELVEDAPWLVNPGSPTVPEYKNGKLSAHYHAGVPGAVAAKTLLAFLECAAENDGSPEVSVRLSDILSKTHRRDTGPNRATIERHMQIWAGAELQYGCRFDR